MSNRSDTINLAAQSAPKAGIQFADDAEQAVDADAETAIPIDRRNAMRRGFSVPSTAHELRHAEERWPEGSWQLRTLEWINSDRVQKILICLLLLDVIIIFTELAIDVWAPSCKMIARDAISCCPADEAHAEMENNVHRFLEGGGDDSHGHICEYPLLDTNHPAGCDPHKYPGVHIAHDVLFWTTIVILLTFMLELASLIYLLGPQKFFHQFIYVIDLFVVSCSLILELAFHFISENQAMEAFPGILIMFRLWRFVRIGHGLVASTYEVQEHKTHLAMEHIEELERRLRKYECEIPERPEKLRHSKVNGRHKDSEGDMVRNE